MERSSDHSQSLRDAGSDAARQEYKHEAMPEAEAFQDGKNDARSQAASLSDSYGDRA